MLSEKDKKLVDALTEAKKEILNLPIGNTWEKENTKIRRISNTLYETYNGGYYNAIGDISLVEATLKIDLFS